MKATRRSRSSRAAIRSARRSARTLPMAWSSIHGARALRRRPNHRSRRALPETRRGVPERRHALGEILGLHLQALRQDPPGRRRAPHPNPTLPAPHQRQGRALHPDQPARMGLRQAVRLLSPAHRRGRTLDRRLQPPPTPCRHRRPQPLAKTEQSAWQRHLGVLRQRLARRSQWRPAAQREDLGGGVMSHGGRDGATKPAARSHRRMSRVRGTGVSGAFVAAGPARQEASGRTHRRLRRGASRSHLTTPGAGGSDF